MTNTPHAPYIIWLTRSGKVIARCRTCNWYATEAPFQAAAQHFTHQGAEQCQPT